MLVFSLLGDLAFWWIRDPSAENSNLSFKMKGMWVSKKAPVGKQAQGRGEREQEGRGRGGAKKQKQNKRKQIKKAKAKTFTVLDLCESSC